jgi:hypothetical protein
MIPVPAILLRSRQQRAANRMIASSDVHAATVAVAEDSAIVVKHLDSERATIANSAVSCTAILRPSRTLQKTTRRTKKTRSHQHHTVCFHRRSQLMKAPKSFTQDPSTYLTKLATAVYSSRQMDSVCVPLQIKVTYSWIFVKGLANFNW